MRDSHRNPAKVQPGCCTLPFRSPESWPVPFAEAGSKSLQPTPVNLLIGACCGLHHNLILWRAGTASPSPLFPRTGLLPTLLLIASEDLQDSQRQERFYVRLNNNTASFLSIHPSLFPCSSGCFSIFSSFFQKKARTVSLLLMFTRRCSWFQAPLSYKPLAVPRNLPGLFSSKGTLWYLKEESVNVLDKV